MLELDLTNVNLFDSLLTIDYGKESFFDLHNEFTILSIEYKKNDGDLIIYFLGEDKEQLRLIFEEVVLLKFDIPTDQKGLSLDNFHRGRFEHENKLYDSHDNKNCFYIEFSEKGDLNLLTSRVKLIKETYGKIIQLE